MGRINDAEYPDQVFPTCFENAVDDQDSRIYGVIDRIEVPQALDQKSKLEATLISIFYS